MGSQDFSFPTVEEGFKARPDLGGASDIQPGDPGAPDTFSATWTNKLVQRYRSGLEEKVQQITIRSGCSL